MGFVNRQRDSAANVRLQWQFPVHLHSAQVPRKKTGPIGRAKPDKRKVTNAICLQDQLVGGAAKNKRSMKTAAHNHEVREQTAPFGSKYETSVAISGAFALSASSAQENRSDRSSKMARKLQW